MELEKTPYRIRCEMGVCKNTALYTVKLSRCGVRSRIHICESCMKELGALINGETAAKPKTKRSKTENAE